MSDTHTPLPPCPTCGACRGLGRATQSDLEELHGLLAEVLVNEIRKQRAKSGGRRNGSSRFMGVALAFLKLNGITTPAASQRAIDELLSEMPDLDELS